MDRRRVTRRVRNSHSTTSNASSDSTDSTNADITTFWTRESSHDDFVEDYDDTASDYGSSGEEYGDLEGVLDYFDDLRYRLDELQNFEYLGDRLVALGCIEVLRDRLDHLGPVFDDLLEYAFSVDDFEDEDEVDSATEEDSDESEDLYISSTSPTTDTISEVGRGVKRRAETTEAAPPEKRAHIAPTCPVCMLHLDERQAVATGCGHVTCYSCMQYILRFDNRRRKCPVCRARISRYSNRNLYM